MPCGHGLKNLYCSLYTICSNQYLYCSLYTIFSNQLLIMLGYAPLITCASTDKRNPHSHKSVILNQISSAEFEGLIIFTLFE